MKKIHVLLAALLVNGFISFGAPPPPPSAGGTGTPSCWPPPCVPIDSGIVVLMTAGALLGAKKIYDFRKKSQTVS